MDIPIGEYFEIFVRGLKSGFGGFFDAISETIDIAISTIERVLSMDPSAWFSSATIFIIFGLLLTLLIRRWTSFKIAIIAGVVSIVAFGALEIWRRGEIAESVTPDEAKSTIALIEGVVSQSPQALSEASSKTLKRVSSRYKSVDVVRPKVDLLGARTYSGLIEMLAELESIAAENDKAGVVDSIKELKGSLADYNPGKLAWYSWFIVMLMLILCAWLASGRGLAIFALIGMSLIQMMGFWGATTDTLALVFAATGFALLLGVPLGIAAAANKTVDQISKPILDFMQTMPAFVYLIPAVLLFGLGKVPGAMATLIFAMPPAVRLTSLGIRSVPTEVVEAAQSFGSTPMQLLFKAQLPIAMPTILAGLNQTIMLSLSMVVVAGMIGAGGLGEVVLSGITQLKIGLGFESGLCVVILAIYLDRLTQSLGKHA